MALSTRPYKGTRDFYPEDMRLREWMFSTIKRVVQSFGYEEYDGPMLESFDLYAAKTGEEIVNQQLYHLMDQGERKLAVRPEMTPTLARMVAGKINELPRPIRWFSIPNLWRYERPQRGRLREHWQLNVDVLGGEPILADAEIIEFAVAMMREFGGEDKVAIRVNNRHLMDEFFQNQLGLKAEQALQTTKAIDARDKIGEEAYQKWLGEIGLSSEQSSKMESFFSLKFDEIKRQYPCEGTDQLTGLFELTKESGIADQVVFDPKIMRGLDYYTGTVFEMYDQSPENNRAMFGGGRYDNLVGLFGKDKLSGVGFGMGDVTLQNFLETHGLVPKEFARPAVFVTLPERKFRSYQQQIAKEIRAAGLEAICALEEGNFKKQLKAADRSRARFALLIGENEVKDQKVTIKELATGEQSEVALAQISKEISSRVSG